LETTTIKGTVVFYAVGSGNNRPVVNSVAMQQQSKCFLYGPITGFIKPVIELL
jgi:hypothetical protein